MKYVFSLFGAIAILLSSCSPEQNTTSEQKTIPTTTKTRTIITTDGEIDDIDSFIRMLLYANEFDIEGLIYSSSMWHYKGDGKGTNFVSEMEMTLNLYGEKTDLRWPGVKWMQELIAAYEEAYPNLTQHANGYPTPDYLRSLVRVGNIDFEGEMEKDTEGSDFIREKLLDDEVRPIYIQVWGGTNTVARALKSIEDTYRDTPEWPEIYKKVSEKAIIYAILDQDATYRKYISRYWQDIKIYYNANQFWCFAYPWKQVVPEPWQYYLEGEFMGEHIIQNHGPLTKKYYSYGDGQKQEGDDEHIHGDPEKLQDAQWGTFSKFDFISEGDSPAFLHLMDIGLDNLDHPEFGGWGGRLVQSKEQPNRWEDGEAAADFNPFTGKIDKTFPQTRWIPALQNDFAARADWCVKDFQEANHPPMVYLDHENNLTARPNQEIALKGEATDPDGDSVSYKWWQYKEVGSYKGGVDIRHANSPDLTLALPSDMKEGEDIHLILEVTDTGEHPLTRYQRVIITCEN